MSSKGAFVEAGADGKNLYAPPPRQQQSDSDAPVATVAANALFLGNNTNRSRYMYCSNPSCYSYNACFSSTESKANSSHLRTSCPQHSPVSSLSAVRSSSSLSPSSSASSGTNTYFPSNVYPSPELSDIDDDIADPVLDNNGQADSGAIQQPGRQDLRRRPSLDPLALTDVEQHRTKRFRQTLLSPRSVRTNMQIPTPIFSRSRLSIRSPSPHLVCPPAPRLAHAVLPGLTMSLPCLSDALDHTHLDDDDLTVVSDIVLSSSPLSSSSTTVLSTTNGSHTPLHPSFLDSPPYHPADVFPDNNEDWHEQVVEFDWASSTDEDDRKTAFSDSTYWSGIDCKDESLSELETCFGLDGMDSPPYQPTDYNELNPALDPQETRWFEQPTLPPHCHRDSSPPYVPFDYNTLNAEIDPNEDRYFEQSCVKYVGVKEDYGFDSAFDGDVSSNDMPISDDDF
ncbi:hypothetical protein BGZ95_003258 [Linnemannia exigua]|uniref:Uncharacterized protein n=1 Tax=Linnemannia exigua TaxID=604196 RepID=A0AAD4D4X0_9FUNG|nr:hypothetical protein BGZ95_003258 [Linnemannia exigua]